MSFLNVVCYAMTFLLASLNHISIFLSVFCDARDAFTFVFCDE
jgi:hypothetical protein